MDELGRPYRGEPARRSQQAAISYLRPGGIFRTVMRSTALAVHKDEEGCRRHEEMGFHEGGAKALDHLVDTVRSM
jgi:hypothetical protein